MTYPGVDAQFRAAQARYEQISAEYDAKVMRVDEEALERKDEDDRLAAEAEREREAARAARAAEAQAAPEEPDDKPDNPWAQPTRRPDSAARIGSFDDEEGPLPANDVGSPAAAPPPVQAPVTPSEPPVAEPPAPVRGRHARLDDDDDFESGSFLRG